MGWRTAKCLDVLLHQVDAAFPGRDKSSDGTLGDAAHAATKSEHNPDENGVVRARDITHDPAHGLDARKLAEALIASRDSRILYVISNAQICSSKVQPWVWRPYNGVNAHRAHMHLSVVDSPALYDDDRPWGIDLAPAPPKEGHVLIKMGDRGPAVIELQTLLNVDVDGEFGPNTDAAVRAFQIAHDLDVDGEVGGATWAMLMLVNPMAETGIPASAQTSKGSWYSQHSGKYEWHDSGDAPGSAALGVPDDAQGIARPSKSDLGKWYAVRAPNGHSSLEIVSDLGPAAWTGRTIDISAAAAERLGYSPANFPTDSIFTFWPVDPPKEVAGLSKQQQAIRYRDIRKGLPMPDPVIPPLPKPPPTTIPVVPVGADLQLYAARALQFLVDHEGQLHQLLSFAVNLNNAASPHKVTLPTGVPSGATTDPVTQRPSVQFGVLGAIAAALGWQTGIVTPDTGSLIGIAAGGIAALGATGMFGPIGKFASSAYQMWKNVQTTPPTK